MQFSGNDKQMKAIKLIVWDLDDTFWHGTLSEGSVQIPQEHLDLVKTLAFRGIVSSICSKNDLEPVEKRLEQAGILPFFVFKSVDWTPKGGRIQKLIEDMNLRPANVLFLDDNVSNLREAEFCCPELMTAGPDMIGRLIQAAPMLGKDDAELSRLAQYRVLEGKKKESLKFSSNEEFLFSSDIVIEIRRPADEDCERIHELIQRSNQLNFTKVRSSLEEVGGLVRDPDVQCGCVYVGDKFGQYGMVGFYAIRDHKYIHFLFSCRTMGMGIEQYVYAYLDYPELTVVPPVSGSVDRNLPRPPYIREGNVYQPQTKEEQTNQAKILLKGPCDLQVMASYIESEGQIAAEFNFVNDHGEQMDFYNHSVNILNTFSLPEQEKQALAEAFPFLSCEAYHTSVLSEPYDIICLSPLMDATLSVYRNKEKGYCIPYGLYSKPMTDEANWTAYQAKQVMTARSNFTKEMLEHFQQTFEAIDYRPEDIAENFASIIARIQNVFPKTKFVIITLPELAYHSGSRKGENPLEGKEHVHKAINDSLHAAFDSREDIRFLDVNQYIKSQADYFDNINHYSKIVYYKLAQELIAIIREETPADLNTKSKRTALVQNLKRNTYKLLCKLLGKM